MRIATVVIPVCTIAAAAGLASLGALLRHRPSAAPAAASCPQTCGVAVPQVAPPAPPREPRYLAPIGGEYLPQAEELLLGGHQAVPLLFLLDDAELDGYRYGWQMPDLADRVAKELADVLDDGCTAGCSPDAERARALVHAFVDSDRRAAGAAHATRRDRDDAGLTTHERTITIRERAGATSLDVRCTCESSTVGMRMWNDIVSCEATLRERGREVLRYSPTQRTYEDKESILEPVEAWDQTVTLAGGATLVTETGWDYDGDNVNRPLRKTTPRTGPHWR